MLGDAKAEKLGVSAKITQLASEEVRLSQACPTAGPPRHVLHG